MKLATKDGLPRSAFAYAPTADPSTWKLPYLTAGGRPDDERLPAAAAALSEAGLPDDSLGMVKAKLRQAFKRAGKLAEIPDAIREVDTTIAEALDAAAVTIAETEQSFNQITTSIESALTAEYGKPYPDGGGIRAIYPREVYDDYVIWCDYSSNPCAYWRQSYSIDGVSGKVTLGDKVKVAEQRTWVTVAEAGKRHSAKDADILKSIPDAVSAAVKAALKDVGVDLDAGTIPEVVPPTPDVAPVTEASVVVPSGASEALTFREASSEWETVTLAEAAPVFEDKTRTVWITPIKPGWGNKRDKNYYPSGTVKEATAGGKFDHLKMFKDHPRKSDEKELPERSVKDWFATTREAVWDEAKQVPRVPIVVHEDADFRRMKDAPEQVAFSVLGGGRGRKGTMDGTAGRIVEAIDKVRSVDWVTEAGAGGAIAFAESAASEEFEMDLKNMTAAQVLALKESDPTLYEQFVAIAKEVTAPAAAPAAPAATPVAEAAKPDAPKPDAEPAWAVQLRESIATIGTGLASIASVQAAASTAAIAEAGKAAVKKVVDTAIAESVLPTKARELAAAKFAEAKIGEGGYADEAALREAIGTEISGTETLLRSMGMQLSKVQGLGGTAREDKSGNAALRESLVERVDKRVNGQAAPRAQKTTWSVDELAGVAAPAAPVRESQPDKPGLFAADGETPIHA